MAWGLFEEKDGTRWICCTEDEEAVETTMAIANPWRRYPTLNDGIRASALMKLGIIEEEDSGWSR